MNKRLAPLFVCCFFGLALVSVPASAGPLDVYGFGGRGTAMGGAQSAGAEGPEAIFYNVGSLAEVDQQVAFGTIISVNQAEILLHDRPGGYEVPDLGNDSPSVPTGKAPRGRSDTTAVPGYRGLVASGVTSFGVEGLRAGFYMSVPISGFIDLETHFADERERLYSNKLHYEFIGKSLGRFDIGLGVAYRLTPWLSVGVGGMFVPSAVPTTDVFVEDLANQSDVDLNTDVETTNNWGLMAGTQVDILSNLRLGLAYRGEVFFRIHGKNRIILGTADPAEQTITQTIDWTPTYSPETFSGGVGWSPGRFDTQAGVEFKRWSNYVGNHSEPTSFNDTLSPRVGVEYQFSPTLDIRAGAGYEPTPIPPQTGRTNYVGNDRITASFGAGHAFDLWGQPVALDWTLQLQNLIAREVDKKPRDSFPNCGDDVSSICDEVPDSTENSETGRPYAEAQGLQTGNPGFPGFSSGGWMAAIVLDLSWRPDLAGDEGG